MTTTATTAPHPASVPSGAAPGAQTLAPASRSRAPAADPLWYRNAVIYQMHVRSFSDSNADGIGDFGGLISKLDYLEELGVTAIWLLPFYPSPLKDDGYDTADYTDVNPMYGTVEEARRLIAEAHRRGIRIITELVINHTSDQHRWFQRARRAPRGSSERDFYVWSDTPQRYSGVRVIFKDFEPANWTFDHVAGQYFWHRFFHHQPDLNFDNPAVHDAVFKVCDFWMAAGVDGVRLDAVPYLYEREGTSCENLPETHAFLKKLRAHVEQNWPGRMLLAEANQWPEDAVQYFGNGDECHMNFHFPLMPRLFMSLRMEDRYPIIDILEQTPPIPANCQWAMFLRNHDELTLEMVTDEERDYMWRVYANDPSARINMGIRRRLAPLLDNNRRKIELMNALLFSMPGSPIIYYGDEIGMGDNIFLGDRNGVRTPMQWSADRNAGFSRANPQRLFLPIIIDPEYHYESINVEAQWANPSSLLWWMKRLIALRRSHPVFGHGDIHFLAPENPKVLAFLRREQREQVLVVANLSRFTQPVDLDLSDYRGAVPVEMFGNVRFPAVGESGRYFLSLGPHSFFWFLMEPASSDAQGPAGPDVRIDVSADVILDDPAVERLLEQRLPRLLPTKRWFVSKARTIRAARMAERINVPSQGAEEYEIHRRVFLVQLDFTEGEPELYALPLSAIAGEDWPDAPGTDAGLFLRIIDAEDQRWVIQDGMLDPTFARLLLQLAMQGGELRGQKLRLLGRLISTEDRTQEQLAQLPVRMPRAQQSNSNVLFDEALILKLYRRIGEAVNPELEVGEHLAHVGFTGTPPLAGAIELLGGPKRTLAVVLSYMQNQGDAWQLFLDHAQRYYERLAAATLEEFEALCLPGDHGCAKDQANPPPAVAMIVSEALELSRRLGQRTAEMHAALAQDSDNADFSPEPYSMVYQRSLLQSMRNSTRATMQALRSQASRLAGSAAEMAHELLGREPEVLGVFRDLTGRPIRAARIRIHGDYHLEQVLWTGKDFLIIDFEGEPLKSVGERRLKRSPLRDVAGMVRSFDYAAWTGLRRHWELISTENDALGRPSLRERDILGARIWSAWLAHEFVRAHAQRLRELRGDLVPPETTDAELVLSAWVLEKALYEVRYELNSRPDWVEIPLRAVLGLLASLGVRPQAHPVGSPQ